MKKIKAFIILMLSLAIGVTCTTYASNDIKTINKSEAFERWENLSEEERSQTIQPQFFTINFSDSIKKSSYNKYTQELKETITDSKYNLKDDISITVKNQKSTNSCWAFSFTSVLETTMAKKYTKNVAYSPMHMEYTASSMYSKTILEGGNAYLALAYSTSGNGPVYEEDFSFDSVYNEETNSSNTKYLSDASQVDTDIAQVAMVEDASFFASIYKSYGNDNTITYTNGATEKTTTKTYTEDEITAFRNLIKQHIKEDGAVSAAMYMDLVIDSSNNVTSKGNYFNSETSAYYVSSLGKDANHSVAIIGWDDTYSKENFSEENQPINDGAYIVLNSYGDDILDGGYMYVSYDDEYIEQMLVGINSIAEYENSQKDYDNLYQYDELGMSVPISYLNDAGTTLLSSGYMANIYTRTVNDTKSEYINEVGIYLDKAEGVEIYVNLASDDLTNLEKVASYTGSAALEAGYHKIELSSPQEITGEKFVVAIKYINEEGASAAIECNLVSSGITTVSNYWDAASSSEGESFISTDGENWSDLYGYSLYGIYTLKDTNACIKAFTTYSDKQTETPEETKIAVTGVTLDKTESSMQVGDTQNLVATITPENASNKNVTWSSSNESVATISETGIINALSEGETVITVTTEDGNYTAQCNLTVTEEVEDPDDIYKSKEDDTNDKIDGTEVDKTQSNSILPNTGSNTIIFVMVIIAISSTVICIRYRRLKNN